MKHIYTIITFLFIAATTVQAKPVITFTAWWGDWSTPGNWDLNRIPRNGDSIVIPQYKGVVFDKPDTLSNIYIKVIGGLTIQKAMRLSANSIIELAPTGRLNAWGAQRTVETISIGGVRKYDQRAPYNVYGPAYASSSSGESPNGFNLTVLPVIYNSFYATKSGNNVVLTWSTSREMNNLNYEVQRSVDGNNWSVVGVVMGAGNSNIIQQYSFTDKNVTAPVAYYRIRQVDVNGQHEYSTVKTIRGNETAATTKIYASGNTVNIEFNQEIKNPVSVRIINMSGQVVGQRDRQQAGYKITMNVNQHISGAHVIQLSDGTGWNEVKKVVL